MSDSDFHSVCSGKSGSDVADEEYIGQSNQHNEPFEISGNDGDDDVHIISTRITSFSFYNRPRHEWIPDLCEVLFEIKKRETTIQAELYFGVIHFISCFYCLAVIPAVLASVNYSSASVFAATALVSGIGCIIGGLVSNLPFPLAPPTAVTIFLKTRILADGSINGSAGVILSGFAIMVLGIRPIAEFLRRLIPVTIQVGTSVGIGLLTALAGAVEVDIIVQGDVSILTLGDLSNPSIYITLFGIVLIPILYNYHIKGPFAVTIVLCSLIGWAVYNSWPTGVANIPHLIVFDFSKESFTSSSAVTVIDLTFLYFLYVNGLMASLSRLAKLTDAEGHTPRMYSLYLVTGAMTVFSGLLNGAPVLLSPEGAAACHDGAKTGLSSVVCGVLFLLSIFFSPIFSAIPQCGTSPILIMVGVLLFQNVLRVDWTHIKACTPAFIVLFFVPFSYNLFVGVIVGYITYVLINGATGDLLTDAVGISKVYCPSALDAASATLGKVMRGNKEIPPPPDNSGEAESRDTMTSQIAATPSFPPKKVAKANEGYSNASDEISYTLAYDTSAPGTPAARWSLQSPNQSQSIYMLDDGQD